MVTDHSPLTLKIVNRRRPLILRPLLLAVALSLAPASHAHADECRSTAGSEVITRDEILNAGLARLSEIFRLSDRWFAATIDGYSWYAQVSGLSPLSNPRWAVLINGVPMDIGLFDTMSLDVLPIHIQEVECVELISHPHTAAGRLFQAGAVHISTREPDPGMTLGASVAAGNEVNDPGPFAYTPQVTPNIDRIGPIGTGRIEIRSGNRFARLSGRLDEFHVTDEQIDLRARQLYKIDSKPRINAKAAALTAAITTPKGPQRILAGRSETEDLLFFETFGLEIPSTRRVDVAAAAGALRFGSGELSYHGSYLSYDLLERPNAAGLAMDFRKRVVSGGLQSRLGTEPLSITLGGSVDISDASTNRDLTDTRTIISRTFASVEGSYRQIMRASAFGTVIQVDERLSFAVMPNLAVSLTGDRWIGARASYEKRAIETDPSLWRWARLGYTLPERPYMPDEPSAARIAGPIMPPAPETVTADVNFGGRMPEGVEYTFGAFFRRSIDDYYAEHDIDFNEESTGLLTNTKVVYGVSGDYFGVHASLGLNLVPGLMQRVAFVAEGVVSADTLFEQAQERVPSQRISLTTTYAPNDRFSLYARVRYSASTAWNEYEGVSPIYPWEIPATVLVDVAATKRLWYDHIVANLAVRNMLNEPYRGHPAGAVFNMAFHFAVHISFNSESRF